MEVSDELLCLFNAEVERTEDGHVVRIPRREIDTGTVDSGAVYRVALISRDGSDDEGSTPARQREAAPTQPQPPVEEGEVRYVEIEDLGKQGDGIARVERDFVIIVPDTEVGEQVKVEITEVRPNVAFGQVIEETFE